MLPMAFTVHSASTRTEIVTASAHLQLTEMVDHPEEEDIEASDNSSTLFEYVYNNSTVFASIGTTQEQLEKFAVTLNLNASVELRRQRVVEGDGATAERLRRLWECETLLSQWRDPLSGVLKSDKSFNTTLFGHVKRMELLHADLQSDDALLRFLQQQHLLPTSEDCLKTPLLTLAYHPSNNETATLQRLKRIAEWFRSSFPYYYDSCLVCGNRVENAFVGYIRPSAEERFDRAGRTELYSCGSCRNITRFPRFNSLNKVLQTRRGRCGEYSMLVYRVLRLMNYTVRWVVDWADHVWVEVMVAGRWVHLDPCEAAVDEPLIYQGWGKNQTYIFSLSFDEGVQDVTATYTSDLSAALSRRDETAENITLALQTGSAFLLAVGRKTSSSTA